MSNVNNLNGIPNFGHGEPGEAVIPTVEETPAIDEINPVIETEVNVPKLHKSKVKSAAHKAFGGKY